MLSADEPLSTFDFISDQQFKGSLLSDYREMLRCLESGAWKAVHVLAGSVVEAILIDYLVTTDYQKRKGTDPLKMDLAGAITACKADGVLSDKAADLSSVVRGYRNLIHPGRVIRLNEKINEKTATIAKALVDVIIQEITEARADKYGFTAEQIANKMDTDPSSFSMLRHFLQETNEHERERLACDVLMRRYFVTIENEGHDSAGEYAKWFRQTFDTLPAQAKAGIARRFPKMLREEGADRIRSYEGVFFLAKDMEHLAAADRDLVKAHLLGDLHNGPSVSTFAAMKGLGTFLKNELEIRRVTNGCVWAMAYNRDVEIRRAAQEAIERLSLEVQEDQKELMLKSITGWIDTFKEKGMREATVRAEELKNFLDQPEPPF